MHKNSNAYRIANGLPLRKKNKTVEDYESEAKWIGDCLVHPNVGTTVTVRAVYKLRHGPYAKGLCVCHTCDNPPCINDAHHWLGTHADNMRDKDEKGRGADTRGESNGNAKLTVETVLAIKDAPTHKAAIAISVAAGGSRYTAYDIRSGRRWRHI